MTDRIAVGKSSPSTAFYLEADVIGTSGNSSIVRCYLRCVNTGNSSSGYFDSGYQAGSIDGIGEFGRVSGNPFLPSGYASGQQRWRTQALDVPVPHNPDGTRAPITLRMTLVYGNVNESYTAALALPTIPKAPPAPIPFATAPDEITATSMRFQFNSGGTGGSPIIEWETQYDTSSSFNVDPKTISSWGTSVLTPLQPGTTYYMRARGRNAMGWGAYSVVKSGTTLGGPPSVPTGLLLITTPPNTIKADWEAPSATGGKPITGYDVQLATNAAFTTGVQLQSVGASPTDYSFTGLAPAVQYWVRVRAKNADATGDWGTAISAMIPAGGKAWTGTVWKAAVWKAWTGSIWKTTLLRVWNGTQWVLTK